MTTILSPRPDELVAILTPDFITRGELAGLGGAHNLLSATHSDTLAASPPARGSLIVGNATPVWSEFVIGGASGSILTRNATDPLWSSFYLAGSAGHTYTFPDVTGGTALGAGTLTVATANDATIADHTHAITTSSNPGAATSILASAADGGLQLIRLGIGADGDTDNRITMVNGGQIGQTSGALMTFDDGNNYLEITGCSVGVGTSTPDRKFHVEVADRFSDMVTYVARLTHSNVEDLLGLDDGGGVGLEFELTSDTPTYRIAATIDALWVDTTDATRQADLVLYAYDTAAREFVRGRGSGSAAAIGFLGALPIVRPAAMTAQKTTLTYTAPVVEDFAIQDFVDVSLGAGWAFASHDEANSVLVTIANLQTRLGELEDKLGHTTGLGLITH